MVVLFWGGWFFGLFFVVFFCLVGGFAKSLCIQLMSIVYGGCVDA